MEEKLDRIICLLETILGILNKETENKSGEDICPICEKNPTFGMKICNSCDEYLHFN